MMEKDDRYKNVVGSGFGYKALALALMINLTSCNNIEQSAIDGSHISLKIKDKVKSQQGDGIYSILRKGGENPSNELIIQFKQINNMVDDVIIVGRVYQIPHNGKSHDKIKKDASTQSGEKDKANISHTEKSVISKKMINDIDTGYKLLDRYDSRISIPILDKKYIVALTQKESQGNFDAISKTGARGYGQLKANAIADVSSYLRQAGINKKFDPIKNHRDHCFYVILYFSLTQKRLLDEGLKVSSKDDLFDFTLASYNAGVNKIMMLYNTSKKRTREGFAKYIVADLMKLKAKPSRRFDSQYRVEYRDWFNGKDLSDNKNLLKKGTYKSKLVKNHQGYSIVLDVAKAYEFVRYVEVSNAILDTYVQQ